MRNVSVRVKKENRSKIIEFLLYIFLSFFFFLLIIGISPQSSYDLPENVTPIVEESEQDAMFNKVKEMRKEPIIKLHRLTEFVSKINFSKKPYTIVY